MDLEARTHPDFQLHSGSVYEAADLPSRLIPNDALFVVPSS